MDPGAEDIDYGARQLVSEARRLGLTWGMRPATMQDRQYAVYDGDEATTLMINLTGRELFTQQRVMGIFVPPAGNFVIGTLDNLEVLFRARRANAQSIPNSAETAIEWDTIDVDTHLGWNSGAPTIYSVPFPGWYRLSGGAGWAAGGTGNGRRGAFWYVDGAALFGANVFMSNVGSTGGHSISARTVTTFCEAGAQIHLTVFQEQGSSLNTGAGGVSPSIDIEYVRTRVSSM